MLKLRNALPTIGYTAAIVVFVCAIFILIFVPQRQVSSLRNAKGVNAKDVFKAENDARTTLAQILGGFAVLIGVAVTWRNLTATKEGQITDRFYKAIEQLGAAYDDGKPKLELRLGGIYALERIARDSERDHWPIMEVLTAYVRENTQRKEANLPSADSRLDIQAIITVICRREWGYEKPNQYLDLHQTDLSGVRIWGAHLWGANLAHTNLTNAVLSHANLTQADLMHTNLARAILAYADLTRATLMYADLTGAWLRHANLEGAWLTHANLTHANLKNVNLTHAHLEGSNLICANLAGANLENADLEGVNLERTFGDARTRLPAGVDRPESWPKQAS